MKKAKVALVSMLMLASCGLYAQTDGIGGKVTDHNGEPIIPTSLPDSSLWATRKTTVS